MSRIVWRTGGRGVWVRYRFLIRLIALGLMLLFIVSLSSTFLIFRRSYRQLMITTEESIQSMAKNIDESMQENISLFHQIGRLCIENPSTYEQTIRNYSELTHEKRIGGMPAEELLKGFSMSLPVLSGVSIYYHNSGNFLYAVYSDSHFSQSTVGMTIAAVYCRMALPDVDSDAFMKRLDTLEEPCFFSDEGLLEKGQIVYLLPAFINAESANRRLAVFNISSQSLNRTYGNLLGNLYAIEQMDFKGDCIYRRQISENAHLFRYENEEGFSIVLSMPESVYATLFTEYSGAILRLGIVSMVLCAAFIAFFIFFMYKPVNRIVQSTDAERKTDEISAILGYISRKKQTEAELREELESEKQIMRRHHLEMLLLGISVEQNDDVLQDAAQYHFVAVSPLSYFPELNKSIQLLQDAGNILAYDQLRSNQLIMIIASDQESGMVESFRETFSRIFGSKTPLGVGSVCERTDRIHRSFLDALLDLKKGSAAGEEADDIRIELVDPKDFELFRTQLVSNDLSCVQTAEKMFRQLDKIAPSFLYYWHCYCQLMEKIGTTLQQYGYSINLADYLKCMSEKDIQMAYVHFLRTLEGLVSSGPQRETAVEKKYGDSIVDYIQKNINNELFSISDVAERFNLSGYTTSQMIRDKTNMNFKRYLTHVRLEEGKRLLTSTDTSIQDIALQCGFSSSSYFIRVFKTEVGITPLQYRNSLKN